MINGKLTKMNKIIVLLKIMIQHKIFNFGHININVQNKLKIKNPV